MEISSINLFLPPYVLHLSRVINARSYLNLKTSIINCISMFACSRRKATNLEYYKYNTNKQQKAYALIHPYITHRVKWNKNATKLLLNLNKNLCWIKQYFQTTNWLLFDLDFTTNFIYPYKSYICKGAKTFRKRHQMKQMNSLFTFVYFYFIF